MQIHCLVEFIITVTGLAESLTELGSFLRHCLYNRQHLTLAKLTLEISVNIDLHKCVIER